ncbi:hypothetical protein BB934_26460 [Microvirga ossetica]|uniref:Uncharacterized protein n=1 Tax=Microvirga ossetica TaxID=1882682 RepID=A0A1B2EMY0_9HYPH|nr:hypothetical protein [Microvirga ossetica]ANY81327.1 hypothetical protein BB934_26460 [Microvirga ossetica]
MTDRMAEIRAYNTRQGHILAGRAIPSADELLRLMPFFEDSIREDVLEWVKGEIARLERLNPPERRALLPFQGLLNNLEDSDVVGAKLAQRIDMLMLALAEEDREGRLRCTVYQAALGQRASMITLACNAATALAASAETSPEPTLVDLTLAWAALGWLAALATDDAFVPLSDHPRPERFESSVDTALWHGRAIVRFLSGEAPPKVLLRQRYRDNATQHCDAAERKQWLIRQAGGVLEEDFVADWLGMSLPELRRYTEGGDLIAVDMDGRAVYPAFQLKNPTTVLDVRKILSVMPIRSSWMRLEWFLTPASVLGGDTPWQALRAGWREAVLDLARSHGAE